MIKYSDIRLTTKILVGYIFVGAAILIIVAYSVITAGMISQQQKELVRITDARKTARSLDIDVLRIIVDLQYYARTKDPQLLDNIATNRAGADAFRQELRELTKLKEVNSLLDKYELILPERRTTGDNIIKAVQERSSPEAISQLESDRRNLDNEARGYLREIIQLEEVASKKQQAKADALIESTRKNLLLLTVPLIIFIIFIITTILRSIHRPLKELNQMVEKIGAGDFTFRNTINSKDELGKLAATINTMAADIERLDKAKEEFIALASHQLRTPATAVKNFIGLLKDGYAGDLTLEQRKYVDFAYSSNEQQLQTINDLLRVARSDSGKVLLNKKIINVEELLKSIVDQQLGTLAERNQVCDLMSSDKNTEIMADEEYLRMALENLISNASKYTKPGGKISIKTEMVENSLSISVEDSGVGLLQSDLKKLFVKFSRIPNELSDTVGGSGIGLYLTKNVVDLHEGHIEVKSVLNQGTTFTITLPKGDIQKNG